MTSHGTVPGGDGHTHFDPEAARRDSVDAYDPGDRPLVIALRDFKPVQGMGQVLNIHEQVQALTEEHAGVLLAKMCAQNDRAMIYLLTHLHPLETDDPVGTTKWDRIVARALRSEHFPLEDASWISQFRGPAKSQLCARILAIAHGMDGEPDLSKLLKQGYKNLAHDCFAFSFAEQYGLPGLAEAAIHEVNGANGRYQELFKHLPKVDSSNLKALLSKLDSRFAAEGLGNASIPSEAITSLSQHVAGSDSEIAQLAYAVGKRFGVKADEFQKSAESSACLVVRYTAQLDAGAVTADSWNEAEELVTDGISESGSGRRRRGSEEKLLGFVNK